LKRWRRAFALAPSNCCAVDETACLTRAGGIDMMPPAFVYPEKLTDLAACDKTATTQVAARTQQHGL
jgi:hypothetical protein